MNAKDKAWLEKKGIYLDREDYDYTGYWYIGGYEYQYQYTHYDENGFLELECVTTSPFLVAGYRSKSLVLIVKKIEELRSKNQHRCDGEGASGVGWGFCKEKDALTCEYLPKKWEELTEPEYDVYGGFY